MTTKQDTYDIINERILALIDAGTNPWRKTWSAAAIRPPRNLMSRKTYRGLNLIFLGFSNYESPYWLTFNQARAAGGNVKKGEKASLVTFWKLLHTKKTEDGKTTDQNFPVLRHYYVFNVEQCENVPAPAPDDIVTYTHDPITRAEQILDRIPNKPIITHNNPRQPLYIPSADRVEMPPPERFTTREEYYATLFHELTHATGHTSRLDRDMTGRYGSTSYGREELIAEMGSAYLCGLAGIHESTITNSAAYLDGWRAIIKADKRALVVAAGAAQKAVDYMTNAMTANTTDTETESLTD